MQAPGRSQGVVLDVPLDPIVQENEVMHDTGDAGSRKFGPKVMAEKVAGTGVFFRAFVKSSKADRVLLFFPADTGVLRCAQHGTAAIPFLCHHPLTTYLYCRSLHP